MQLSFERFAFPVLTVVFLAACATSASAQSRVRFETPPRLLVSGYISESVHAYESRTGRALGSLGSVPGAQSVRYGPDRNIYVCSETTARVLRFDGTTGAFLDEFVADDPLTPSDETGGLTAPTAAVFGPDGNLYVASFDGDQVLRYDGGSGAYMDVFFAPGAGGLDGPDAGMVFGPDGHLYVPSFESSQILRFDGRSGVSLGIFVDAGVSGLARPRHLLARGGIWYVSSWASNRVLRFGATGAPLGVFATFGRPTGFAFSPYDGDFYVTTDQSGRVSRFDGTTGAFKEVFLSGAGGLSGGTFVAFLDPRR
jgi:DNA-binding beta-propeller fold protein YncE